MERLQSQQDNLRLWLSADADHIITECESLLRVSEYKEVVKQPSEEEKISSLLRTIINNGAETCESFTEILRKNQRHYHQLQQFFHSSEGTTAPTVFADNNSIVATTNFSNIKGKCLTRNLETESNPRENLSGNIVSGNDYTATGGSVICADRLDGVNVDNMDFSVKITSSRVPSAPGRAADLPCQDPAGKTITEHKVRLTECLMADANYILQHVDQKSIITQREYQNLKAVTEPEKQVIQLIDQVISKGPEKSLQFLQLLKEPKVLETFPQLRNILDTGA
ncbi:uncharacterized protein si:dkey-10c21.1 [Fundulus heteroclitus]|uniref:uncharacterized protein si:dkey-10c21.1 n=1 Tax=Fundulus heteroclitus TaxID=8078 RepID=UPI00165AEFE9|nr:uncharacterized protein si:dkey-10c21.1 [Fundulus heteroclitus]